MAAVCTIIYIVGVTAAIVMNQQGVDLEGVVVGQIILSLPWGLIPVLLRVNAWYGPFVYLMAIVLNAASVYVITAGIAGWLHRRSRPANRSN